MYLSACLINIRNIISRYLPTSPQTFGCEPRGFRLSLPSECSIGLHNDLSYSMRQKTFELADSCLVRAANPLVCWPYSAPHKPLASAHPPELTQPAGYPLLAFCPRPAKRQFYRD